MDARGIASLVGPTLIAITTTEVFHLRIWANNNAPLTYLNGTAVFVAGLAIVRAHNRWRGWPALVSLTSWLALIGGLGRMVAPGAKQAGENAPTYALIAFLFVLGVVLSFNGYACGRTTTSG
jgi:hypothetical protein